MKRSNFIFAFILIIGIFLRVFHNKSTSFFADFDELYTVKTVTFINEDKLLQNQSYNLSNIGNANIVDFFKNASRDHGNNFLYNFILSFFVYLFGFSDTGLRLFSCCCDIFSIYLLFRIGKLFTISNSRILFSCALFLINPVFITYAFVIRAYSFCIIFTLLTFYFFSKVYFFKEKKYVHFSLASIGLFLSHFLTVYIVAVFVIFIILQRRKLSLEQQKAFSFSFIIIFIFCLLYLLINQRGVQSIMHISQSISAGEGVKVSAENNRMLTTENFIPALINYIDLFFSGLQYTIMTESFHKFPFLRYLFLTLSSLFIFFWMYSFQRKQQSDIVRLLFLLIFSGILVSIALAFASSHTTSLSIKYSMFSIPFLLIFISWYEIKNSWIKNGIIVWFVFNCFLSSIFTVLNRGYKRPIFYSINTKSSKEFDCRQLPELVASMDYKKIAEIQFPTIDNMLFYYLHAPITNTTRLKYDIQNKDILFKFSDQNDRKAEFSLMEPE